MKNRIIVLLAVILLFIIAFLSVYFILTAPKYKGEFSIDSFSEDIENYPFESDKKYGNIADYQSAGKIGKAVIDEHCGEYSKGSIVDWIGCDVQYDKENEVYHVRAYHINPFIMGGYQVIIRTDGTVLALMVEK